MKPLSGSEFVRLLGESNMDRLIRCTYEGVRDFFALDASTQARFGPSTRAHMTHDLILARARRTFDEQGDVRFETRAGLQLLVFNERIITRFKKLDDDLCSRNNPTRQSDAYVMQQLLLPGVDELTNVQVGYTLNATGTAPQGLFLTCPTSRKRNRWVISFALPSDEITNIVELRPRGPKPSSLAYTIHEDKTFDLEDHAG